jgi:hypothetical protein
LALYRVCVADDKSTKNATWRYFTTLNGPEEKLSSLFNDNLFPARHTGE